MLVIINNNNIYNILKNFNYYCYYHSSVECLDLAERGECDFYKCLEKTHRCGHTGYALGYGFRYCDRFTVHFHRLTSEVSARFVFAKNGGYLFIDSGTKLLFRV